MLAVGYTEQYANSGRGQKMVYENVRTKAAIARIDAKTSATAEYDRTESMKRKQFLLDSLLQTIDGADTVVNADIARTCNTILKQMDNITGLERQDSYEHSQAEPIEISDEERAALKRAAIQLTG